MADALVERFENEEVVFDWLRPRLQALIEGKEWTATDNVTPKKRDLAHERYEQVIQFWTDLTKEEPDQRGMVDDWKHFISLPREQGKLLSNRIIREKRQTGWELFYLPGKPFMMFEILDHFVCNKMWSEILPAYPKLSNGPGYWYWAKISPTAHLGQSGPERVPVMNVLEYLVCFEMIKREGLCEWDRQTTTVVEISKDALRIVGVPATSQRIRQFGQITSSSVDSSVGCREVWRLNH